MDLSQFARRDGSFHLDDLINSSSRRRARDEASEYSQHSANKRQRRDVPAAAAAVPPPPPQNGMSAATLRKFRFGRCDAHIADLQDQCQAQFDKAKASRQLVTRAELVTSERLKDSQHVDVNALLGRLRTTFNSFGIVPTSQQRTMFELTILSSLPHIIGPTWESRKMDILQELGLKEIPSNIHYIMPRQYGKTTGMSMNGATIGYHIPISMAIFSTGARTARSLNRQIRNNIMRLPDGQKRLVVTNAEVLEISTVPIANKKEGQARPHLNSRIAAYPASGDSKSVVIFP